MSAEPELAFGIAQIPRYAQHPEVILQSARPGVALAAFEPAAAVFKGDDLFLRQKVRVMRSVGGD